MANIKINGGSAVITSTKTLEALQTLEKYRPSALVLKEKDEDGFTTELFRVGTTNKSHGSIGECGATFGGATYDDAKLATITVVMPTGVSNPKEWAAETYGTALNLLNKVEAQIDTALAEVKAERDAVLASITVQ